MGWIAKLFGVEKKEMPRIVMPIMTNLPPMQDFTPRQMDLSPPKEVKEIVFVRLDRFENAEKGFVDAKSKLNEIESNIKAVDEINAKEDERLFSWGKDLEKIKVLLNKIDEKVFDQI